MGKGKQQKRYFSDEERTLIRDLKKQLSLMGVPREQWAFTIQQELEFRRKSKKIPGIPKGKLGKALRKPLEKVKGAFAKFATKGLAKEFGNFSDIFGESSGDFGEDEAKLMDAMVSGMGMGAPRVDEEAIGKHGTFVSERPDKKRKIVDLDLFEEEE